MTGAPQGPAAPTLAAGAPEGIDVEHLRVSRGGKLVLDDLSLRISPGRVTGLLGPSGCGKSTLLRAIVGVQVVGGGRISVFGRPAGIRDLRSDIGYVTQSPAVYGDLTVTENMRYFAAVSGADTARIRPTLDAVSLSDAAGRIVDSLSGGQRSRVALATALVRRPRLLVLDEPTVGLDPVLRRDLWLLFRRLAADGVTLLVSSHVMDEAAECDDLLLMRDGRLLEATTPAALRESTGEHDLAQAFLAVIEGRRAC